MAFLVRKLTVFSLYVLVVLAAVGQDQNAATRLKKTTASSGQDTAKSMAFASLCFLYLNSNPDSALYFAQNAWSLARSARYAPGEVSALNGIAAVFSATGNPDKSLASLLEAIKIAEQNNLPYQLQNTYGNMGSFYAETGDYNLAVSYYRRANDIADQYKIENSNLAVYTVFLGDMYGKLNRLDSALFFVQKGYTLLLKLKAEPDYIDAYNAFGDIYAGKQQPAIALKYYYQSIEACRKAGNYNSISETMMKVARLHSQSGAADSAVYYAKQSMGIAISLHFTRVVKESSEFLAEYYKKKSNTDSAFRYTEMLMAAKDSLYSQEKLKNIKDLQFNEQLTRQESAAQSIAFKNRIRFYIMAGLILVFTVLLLLLWRNNRNKQKAYNLLQQQKAATEMQKAKADKALVELKSTQVQLIQSEKMASLGELTAGIAHEIQNPLNFVNNFSDVNTELIDEAEKEMEKGNMEDVKAILNDIKDNEQKINHHGKRADAIVKGMLQHSRKSGLVKEPTDINKLADEYLRLSYHGLRAKDKSFNATLKTDFDESIGNINIIRQDIGRVILNLVNNAFYAVAEKKKSSVDQEYEPTVTISTRCIQPPSGDWKVEIRVSDNGGGIPEKVVDKIFQPFFTTKPTGQGTGLGLSLAYDIAMAHGGELKVETGVGQGAMFSILIPAL